MSNDRDYDGNEMVMDVRETFQCVGETRLNYAKLIW
jgi:hypothetical protein